MQASTHFNEHVYKYRRFQAWVARQRGRWMRMDIMYQWAAGERADQEGVKWHAE